MLVQKYRDVTFDSEAVRDVTFLRSKKASPLCKIDRFSVNFAEGRHSETSHAAEEYESNARMQLHCPFEASASGFKKPVSTLSSFFCYIFEPLKIKHDYTY